MVFKLVPCMRCSTHIGGTALNYVKNCICCPCTGCIVLYVFLIVSFCRKTKSADFFRLRKPCYIYIYTFHYIPLLHVLACKGKSNTQTNFPGGQSMNYVQNRVMSSTFLRFCESREAPHLCWSFKGKRLGLPLTPHEQDDPVVDPAPKDQVRSFNMAGPWKWANHEVYLSTPHETTM